MDIHDKNFFYQEAAEPIVESILSLMSQGIKEFESYEAWPYASYISSKEENHLHFNWRFSVCRSDENFAPGLKYDIVGLAGRDYFDEPSISIAIVIPKGRHQKKISVKKAELYDVVCHELHHIAQNIDNNTYKRVTEEKGRLSYFLDPFEIEAFHIGIRAHSKISGKKFELIASDYLKKTWPDCASSTITKVVSTWMNTDFPTMNQNIVS